MWDDRIRVVRGFADAITERDVEAALELCHPEIEFFSLLAQLEARPYRGFAGIRRYFKDIDATWEEWRVGVEQLLAAPDGRVVIVMSTHMRGMGAGSDSRSESRTSGSSRTRSSGAPRCTEIPPALRATEMPPLEK